MRILLSLSSICENKRNAMSRKSDDDDDDLLRPR